MVLAAVGVIAGWLPAWRASPIVGIAIGTTASFSFARVLAGVLCGVTPRDPAIFVSVPLLLSSVALLAVSLPAIRAARMTPMNALRYE
jgi:putative ABC transport system permease protein